MKKLFADFKKNEQGNVALMFGGGLFLMIGTLALAIDISKAYSLRSSLTDIADSAALAGAYVATTDVDNRETIVQEVIDFHLVGTAFKNMQPTIAFDDSTSLLQVTLHGHVETSFAGIFGVSKVDVTGQSVTSYGQNDLAPVSMAFVLDVSGSMNQSSSSGGSKIDALQSSVETMFNVIEASAQRKDLLQTKVRTGMTAFDIGLVNEHTVPMGNGWTSVEHEVFQLNPGGDTNTTPAFNLAYQMLADDIQNGDNLRKFIILMSDGENDDLAENANTLLLCDQAKAEGLKVFSVAFEAPPLGQDLLRGCASGNNNVIGNDTANDGSISAPGAVTLDAPTAVIGDRQYYFDAQNAHELEAAFRQIGEEIGKFEPRIIR